MNFNRSVLIGLSSLMVACSVFSHNENKGAKIGQTGNQPLFFNDLWNEYNKTRMNSQETSSYESFLDFSRLYLDYQTKLQAAKDAGYFNNPDILQELKSYEEQYAVPFWMEKEIENKLLENLIQRADTEIEATHILIQLGANSSPADTLNAWNKLVDARNKALHGASFDSLSNRVSTWQNGRSMGGYLSWFSVNQMVQPFEDQAYTTPIDSISMPFRTSFGMHIVKVLNKRPKTPDRFVSHIFWQRASNPAAQDSLLKAAEALRQSITKGEITWVNAVDHNTQDYMSAQNGGLIGWIPYGRYSPIFNDSVFSMQGNHSISHAFQSEYGIHILKLDSVRTYPNDGAKRAEFRGILKQMPVYKNNRLATLKRIEEIVKPTYYKENIDEFAHFVKSQEDSSVNSVVLPTALTSKPVLKIRTKTYTAADYSHWLVENHAEDRAGNYVSSWFNDYTLACLNEFLVPVTKEYFPEFKQTANDYLNGLVVFKISEDSIWNYSKIDTLRLKAMYNANMDAYQYEKRYNFWRLSTTRDSVLQAAKVALDAGEPIDSVKAHFKNVFMVQDVLTNISDEPFDRLGKMQNGETSEVFDYKKLRTFLFLQEELEPRQMTFDEAFYRLAADFQPIREKEWIESLRSKYHSTLLMDKLKESYDAKTSS